MFALALGLGRDVYTNDVNTAAAVHIFIRITGHNNYATAILAHDHR